MCLYRPTVSFLILKSISKKSSPPQPKSWVRAWLVIIFYRSIKLVWRTAFSHFRKILHSGFGNYQKRLVLESLHINSVDPTILMNNCKGIQLNIIRLAVLHYFISYTLLVIWSVIMYNLYYNHHIIWPKDIRYYEDYHLSYLPH